MPDVAMAAARCWCAQCWRGPDHFQAAIESPRFPDAGPKSAWGRAQDADLEPPIDAPWFPAWMIVAERGFAKALAPCGGKTAPERAFDIALALVRGGTDRQNIRNRKSLRQLHPGILQRYLDSLD